MTDLIALVSDASLLASVRWLTRLMFGLESPANLQPMMAYEPPEYVAAAIVAVNQKGE